MPPIERKRSPRSTINIVTRIRSRQINKALEKVDKERAAFEVEQKDFFKTEERQRMFANEYVKGFNATNAYLLAFADDGKTYTRPSAGAAACVYLKNYKVKALIKEKLRERELRTQIDSDAVLVEIAKMAFANPADLYNEDGSLKSIHEIPRELAATIQQVKMGSRKEKILDEFGEALLDENGEPQYKYIQFPVDVKIMDKQSTLKLLGQHLSLFTDNLNIKSEDITPADNSETAKKMREKMMALMFPGNE